VIVTRRGGPEALQVVETELRAPRPHEARIRVQAVPVCAPDVTARYGRSPLVPKPPFTPGYAVLGVVDEVGREVTQTAPGARVAALLGYGGYAEHVLVPEAQLIPVPAALDPAEAAPLILSYLVAYQVLHRRARVQAGNKVLIIGASGGVGTAFLQLGRLADLTMYGVASSAKHQVLAQYGAVPIDYHTQDFVQVIRRAEPGGLDAVFDGMAGDHFTRGFSVLRRGGTLVGYGNPGSYRGMLKVLGQTFLFAVLPNGRRALYYSTGTSRLNRRPFLEDWATLFRLLETGRIKPIIAARFPILEAARANELLEGGQVVGNVVLLAPEAL
jgi:NADPH:quinone reductase-like Zn-dependent oxidoreductase